MTILNSEGEETDRTLADNIVRTSLMQNSHRKGVR